MTNEFEFEEYFDEEVSGDTVGVGGGNHDLVAPGFYQAKVAELEMKDGYFLVDCEVVAGTKESELGKVFRLLLSLDSKEWARKKRVAFCFATGILSREKAKAGESQKVDFSLAFEKHFIIELEQNEYEGKVKNQPCYDNMWHIDDPKAQKKVKINRDSIGPDDPFGNPPAAHAATDEPAEAVDSFFE